MTWTRRDDIVLPPPVRPAHRQLRPILDAPPLPTDQKIEGRLLTAKLTAKPTDGRLAGRLGPNIDSLVASDNDR